MAPPGGGPGRLFVGTSGFAYQAWVPLFYPPGSKGDGLLRHYATRLPACELNNTFYRLPERDTFRDWVERVPDDFDEPLEELREYME